MGTAVPQEFDAVVIGDPKIAVSAIRERLSQLRSEAQRMSSKLPATPQLAVAAARLGDIASRCAS